MSAPPAAFEIRDLSKRFGRRWALANVNYRLPHGRSLVLTGHNGSGKTTLLRLLATVMRATTGTLEIFGTDARADPQAVRPRVGLLSHASFLYEDLTAEQNLKLLAKLLGPKVTHPESVISQTLDRVGLMSRRHHPVRHFSAGMRKRLALARLFLKNPPLVLLDEPFGELDPQGISHLEGVIRDLQQMGSSVVLATHLIEQGLALCQERLHLEEGRMVSP